MTWQQFQRLNNHYVRTANRKLTARSKVTKSVDISTSADKINNHCRSFSLLSYHTISVVVEIVGCFESLQASCYQNPHRCCTVFQLITLLLVREQIISYLWTLLAMSHIRWWRRDKRSSGMRSLLQSMTRREALGMIMTSFCVVLYLFIYIIDTWLVHTCWSSIVFVLLNYYCWLSIIHSLTIHHALHHYPSLTHSLTIHNPTDRR